MPDTELVSVAVDGGPGNAASTGCAVSVHGRYVAFQSLATDLAPGDLAGEENVFLRDRKSGTTVEADVSSTGVAANGSSDLPAISATGRYIAFDSTASNLVDNDFGTNYDVFVHDRVTGGRKW